MHRTHLFAFGGLILQSGAFFQPRSDPMELDFAWFPQITAFVSQVLAGAPADPAARIPVHMTCGTGEENDVNNHIMADALRAQTRALLTAAENAEGFSGHYFVALQQEPQVVMAHAEVIKLIGRNKNEPENEHTKN